MTTCYLQRSHAGHFHSRKPSSETRFSHLLEHLFHLRILAEQVIDFLYRRSRPARNALSTAAVDEFVVISFSRRHRIDDGLNAVDLLLINLVGSLLHAGEWPDAGQHAHNALEGSHF